MARSRIRDSRYGYCYGYVVDIKINIREIYIYRRYISNRNCDCAETIVCLIKKSIYA